MKKYQISCPIAIKHLPSHERYKDELLSLIKQSDGQLIEGSNNIDHITSGDFFCQNASKLYTPLFLTIVKDVVKQLIDEFVDIRSTDLKAEARGLWYQRYSKTDTHSWHDHAYNATFSIIYYLELPRGTPGTEFLDPFTKRVHRPRVKEGDVLMFPSFVRHRSPENKSDQIKTIISLNLV